MRTINELIIIVPVILNLKGNLEMNLSARLGTAANVGDLDDSQTRGGIISGNLSLLQVQATVVSFVAACVSLVLGVIVPKISSHPNSLQPLPSNSTAIPSPRNAASYYLRRHPRPPLPVNNGRSISGFSE